MSLALNNLAQNFKATDCFVVKIFYGLFNGILYDVMSRCAQIRIYELKLWVNLFLIFIPYMRDDK